MRGPFATGAPGLGYRDHLSQFDSDAEIWRQIVPGQTGRGLALGRFGLHIYEEFADDSEACSRGDDPIWVPMFVEWASLTTLNGTQIQPDNGYLELFAGAEVDDGWDGLPMVGLTSILAPWPVLVGPWSVVMPELYMFEYGDSLDASVHTSKIKGLESSLPPTVMPAHMVLPIEDDAVLTALMESIGRLGSTWPMDQSGPSSVWGWSYDIGQSEVEDLRTDAYRMGHQDRCFGVGTIDVEEGFEMICTWDFKTQRCYPCGGAPHITSVVTSFVDELPYEQHILDPLVVPFWDHLRNRNTRLFGDLLEAEENRIGRERDWFYSYLRQWSPWSRYTQAREHLQQR